MIQSPLREMHLALPNIKHRKHVPQKRIAQNIRRFRRLHARHASIRRRVEAVVQHVFRIDYEWPPTDLNRKFWRAGVARGLVDTELGVILRWRIESAIHLLCKLVRQVHERGAAVDDDGEALARALVREGLRATAMGVRAFVFASRASLASNEYVIWHDGVVAVLVGGSIRARLHGEATQWR